MIGIRIKRYFLTLAVIVYTLTIKVVYTQDHKFMSMRNDADNGDSKGRSGVVEEGRIG